MASTDDPEVQRLFTEKNHAVISTLEEDGSVHSAVVWVDLQDGRPAVNSAVGRRWPRNLERDPRATLLVYDESNPYDYVTVRGTVTGTTVGAEAHIDRLASKYLGVETYPAHEEGVQRITYLIEPQAVVHRKG